MTLITGLVPSRFQGSGASDHCVTLAVNSLGKQISVLRVNESNDLGE
jgi:hypothetical protein